MVLEILQAVKSNQKKISRIKKSNAIFRRSIFIIKDMKKEEFFSKENIKSIRPGFGLAPKFFDKILG